MLVKQILKAKEITGVQTIAPDCSIAQAARQLAQNRIGVLVVAQDATSPIKGVISERDIVYAIGLEGGGILDEPVYALMTAKVATCSPDDSTETVMGMMSSGRFRHMPVMDGETLIGLISIGDVVKARIADMAFENSAMTDWIRG